MSYEDLLFVRKLIPENDLGNSLTPIVIGVTGHRDLVPEEFEPLKARIVDLLTDLKARFPNTPVSVMSALAEGADRLAAHAALELGLELQVVLPMPAEEYQKDFETAESKSEFATLCEHGQVLTLPPPADDTTRDARDSSYANVGMFISAHCHILLALWDGVSSDRLGGTSHIIYFHQYDRLPGLSESVPRTSLFLTDNESDLIYHISCSRQRADEDAVPPLRCNWLTTDRDAPESDDIPLRYKQVFRRADEYNLDIRRYLSKGEPGESFEAEPPDTPLREAASRIRRAFDFADALANRFQKSVSRTMIAIYTLAVLTGLAFILYSEVSGFDSLIFAFLTFLLFAVVLAAVAKRRQWHRKYLDYRVLAEGLRVQFYRAIAGIVADGHTKFAYDNFLRQRDMELGWIRNVMRYAGTVADAQPPDTGHAGPEFAIRNWIGTETNPGQLQYYRSKAIQRARMNRLVNVLTLSCLWGGIIAAMLLAFSLRGEASDLRDPLIVMMGILPLIAGVAETYTQRKADRELTKQYEFMRNVFANAERRLETATSDTERREILQGLGDAALSEHAEWILVHRERQPEPAGF